MRKLFACLCLMLILLNPLLSYAEDDSDTVPGGNHISWLLDKTISEEDIVRPRTMACDLEMLHFEATEAYLERYYPEVGPMLYVVFQVYSKMPNSLPVYPENEQEDQIEYNGKSISLEKFRGHRDLVSFEIMSGNNSWSWYEYTDEGLFVFVCIMNPDTKILESASVRSFKCYCENMQTGRTESGTVEVEIPAMVLQSH